MLEKAQKNIQTASNTLYDVMGKRTRAIQQKLKSVKTLSSNEASLILQGCTNTEAGEDSEQNP